MPHPRAGGIVVRINAHLIILFVALSLATSTAFAMADSPVRILVTFPAKIEPSKVYMVTDGELARGLAIPFAVFANNAKLKKRGEELGQQLDATLAGYDRYEAIFNALVTRFSHRSPMFALTQSRDAKYAGEQGVAAAGEQGYAYVLAIEDKFSGLSMLNVVATKTDDVAPLTTLGFQVHETKKRSRIATGNVTANGLIKKPFREAVADRELFVSTYPTVADGVANQIVGTLFRTDVLHTMAQSANRGTEVPQVSAVLKKYEKRFSYEFKPADGWRQTKMNTKYASVLEPKSDQRLVMGLRFDVDLLVAEFGQAVSTVEDYLPSMLGRLEESGIDTTTFQAFSDITVPSAYRVYSFLPNRDGGRQIVMLRVLNQDMIEAINIVFLKDFDALYAQHRAAVEKMIANARLTIS